MSKLVGIEIQWYIRVVGGGVTGQPVHLGQVVCDGTESSLEDCEGVFLSDTTSSHNLDIYIVCLPGTDIYSGIPPQPYTYQVWM